MSGGFSAAFRSITELIIVFLSTPIDRRQKIKDTGLEVPGQTAPNRIFLQFAFNVGKYEISALFVFSSHTLSSESNLKTVTLFMWVLCYNSFETRAEDREPKRDIHILNCTLLDVDRNTVNPFNIAFNNA